VNSEYAEAPDCRRHGPRREGRPRGRYRDADEYVVGEARRIVREIYQSRGGSGVRPWYDRTQPGFHLHIATESAGAPEKYRRETNLASGDVL
jgi:hypothetical protein